MIIRELMIIKCVNTCHPGLFSIKPSVTQTQVQRSSVIVSIQIDLIEKERVWIIAISFKNADIHQLNLPSLRLVLTSTVSKFGLKSAPMPPDIKEPVALVILLISDDLICSESSALAFSEKPNDIVSSELRHILERLELKNFIT